MKFGISLFLLIVFFSNTTHAETDRNYAGVQEFLKKLQIQYPNSTEVFTLATSDSGHEIQGIKIGNGPTGSLVVGTHHGNEYGSTEVSLAFAESIAKHPLDGQTMYVIPVLNISGYDNRMRYERDAAGIYRDPNRDYPGPCGTNGPFHLKSTQALANFVAEKKIVNSSTLHTYSAMVVYPWGISTHDLSTPYDNLFIQFVKAATAYSGYQWGNNTELLYPADGTYEDWAFWEHGVWTLLFELGHSHYPSQEDIDEMIRGNVPGMRDMFAMMPSERAERHEFNGVCDTSRRQRTRLE